MANDQVQYSTILYHESSDVQIMQSPQGYPVTMLTKRDTAFSILLPKKLVNSNFEASAGQIMKFDHLTYILINVVSSISQYDQGRLMNNLAMAGKFGVPSPVIGSQPFEA